MISPTTSTNELSDIDDYFFRVIPPNRTETEHLAYHASGKLKLKSVAVLYDLSNRVYSEGWLRVFRIEFAKRGGSVDKTVPFNTKTNTSFLEITRDAVLKKPDGIVIIAGALDTASICQQLMKLEYRVPIISSSWAFANELIYNGGKAVDGILTSRPFNRDSQEKEYLEFRKDFIKQYRHEPDFGAAQSYEAVQILLDALKRAEDPSDLKRALSDRQVYGGLQGEISLGRFGDASRRRFLITVKDGKFVTLD